MRYGNPSIHSGIKELVDKGVTEILLIPLYPQHAMASTETILVLAEKIKNEFFPKVEFTNLPAFYNHKDYIRVLSNSIQTHLKNKDWDDTLWDLEHGEVMKNLSKCKTFFQTYWNECFSITTLEALSHGIPIILNTKNNRLKKRKLANLSNARRASMNGQVPARLNYTTWLGKQTNDTKLTILGSPKRVNIFNQGKLKLTQFSNKEGKLISLEKLELLSS
jgi:hypothetical protein